MPEQNARLLDSFLSCHHCRERLAKLVKANLAFDSRFLGEALDDPNQMRVRLPGFAGEDEAIRLSGIASLSHLQALQQSVVDYDVSFTRRGIFWAGEGPFRLRGDVHR